MQNKTELLAELKKVQSVMNHVENRVEAALQPVFSIPFQNPLNPELTAESVEITEEYLDLVIERLALELIQATHDLNPVLVGLMDGADFFANKLKMALQKYNDEHASTPYRFDYCTMRTGSYEGTTCGELKIDAPPKILVGGRVVVILDDVADSGKTLAGCIAYFRDKGAIEDHIFSMVLVDKQIEDRVQNPTYRGIFVSGKIFLVGAGMDYLSSRFRQLSTIKAVDKSTLATEEEELILQKLKPLNTALEKHMTAEKEAKLYQNASPGRANGWFAQRRKLPTPDNVPAKESECCIIM